MDDMKGNQPVNNLRQTITQVLLWLLTNTTYNKYMHKTYGQCSGWQQRWACSRLVQESVQQQQLTPAVHPFLDLLHATSTSKTYVTSSFNNTSTNSLHSHNNPTELLLDSLAAITLVTEVWYFLTLCYYSAIFNFFLSFFFVLCSCYYICVDSGYHQFIFLTGLSCVYCLYTGLINS